MTELEKYQMVNGCETSEDLKSAILKIAEDDTKWYYDQLKGLETSKMSVIDHNLPELLIQGRTRIFDANKMANAVDKVINDEIIPNYLTREFGIRQQALYIKTYN